MRFHGCAEAALLIRFDSHAAEWSAGELAALLASMARARTRIECYASRIRTDLADTDTRMTDGIIDHSSPHQCPQIFDSRKRHLICAELLIPSIFYEEESSSTAPSQIAPLSP